MPENYDRLPANPPDYDDFVISDGEDNPSPRVNRPNDDEAMVFHEFDIEDPEQASSSRFSFFNNFKAKAGQSSRRLAYNLNERIVYPMTRVMDPVYELYKNSNIIFDSYLARIGNPLILKRLIYVFSITALIYIITASGIYPNQNEALFGDFYDPGKLNSFIETHINEESMSSTLKYLSSMPHIAGTAGDLTLARFFEETLHNSGLSAVEFYEIDSYVNYPNITSLQLVSDNKIKYKAHLSESFDENKKGFEYFSFNPDSASGEVRGALVYANYGTPEDFKFLVDNNVNLEGKILLVRYGKMSSSQKIEIAEMYSAVGVLFISDPKNSGYSMNSIQRDGVALYKEVPGDVLTPGWASLPNTNRVAWTESNSTPKVISLPISWNDAVPFIESLKGNGVKVEKWDLTLDGKNHEMWSGQTKDEVIMVNKPQERSVKPTWNVIGRITGREQMDKGIIIAAQRDSTCFGAVNPNTGSTVLLELVRLFTKMQTTYNWSPLRSIYFVSFDATNYNLAGSTEWAESKTRELRKEAYAYIDLSDAVSGDLLEIHSHPILKQVIMSSLKEVKEPVSNDTLMDTQFVKRHMELESLRDYNKNYLPFQTYLGIPSMEIKFTGKDYPKDSCFDTFENFENNEFDKDMQLHKTLVELLAKIIVKLVEEPLIPFDVLNYVSALDHYLKDVRKYAESIPGYKGNELDTSSFISALLKLKAIGTEYEGWIKAWREILNSDSEQEPSLLAVNRWTWNLKLTLFEKRLLSNTGLPGRAWYKNVIFGPQYWQPENDGDYEWTTLPGVRDALRGKNWKLAKEQLNFAADLLAIAADSFIG